MKDEVKVIAMDLTIILGALATSFALGLVAALLFFSASPEPVLAEPVIAGPVVKEEPPRTVLQADGVECWFATNPILNYSINDQTVGVRVTCKADILNSYLPAIERTQ